MRKSKSISRRVYLGLVMIAFTGASTVTTANNCDWLNNHCSEALLVVAEADDSTATGKENGDVISKDAIFTKEYNNIIVAAATEDDASSKGSGEDTSADETVSAECAAFTKDIDADLGEVLRAGCQPTLAQMSALMDNPLGNVAMLFTQIDHFRLENPDTGKPANQWNYMGIAQFPKKLTKNWNLINRIVWNVPSAPLDQDKIDRFSTIPGQAGPTPPIGSPPHTPPALINLFEGRTTGFGDMYYVGLFSPSKPVEFENLAGKLVWGVGFDLAFPTASEDILGSGKYSAGPSGLAAYLGPKWKVGALVQQYWDFEGDDDRGDVNITNLQYLWYYSLNETTSIGAAPNIIMDWEQDGDDAFTVPIGIGINKTFQFGKVPVRFGLEFHYNVIQPDDIVGSEYDIRFYVIPAVPSALFKWM
jgi:hypothetical protein